MGTPKDPDEDYGPNYGSSGISKHGIPYMIYASYESDVLKRKTFGHIYRK